MNWLRAIIAGIMDALFGWGQDQADKPKVTTDANTPKDIRDPLCDSRDEWMRDKDRHCD